MSFLSHVYILFLALSALLFWVFVPKRARSSFLMFCSFVFVCSYAALYAFLLLALAIAVHRFGQVLSREPGKRKKTFFFLTLLFQLIGSLCFYKILQRDVSQGAVWPSWAQEFAVPLGLSFVIFRLIHYIVESYRGSLPNASLIEFLHYLFFFPVFLAGPLERFGPFLGQARVPGEFSVEDLNYGLYRIFRGVIKKFLIADYLRSVVIPIFEFPDACSRWAVLGAVYGASIQVYMDFSGYTDIAVGSARLFGYRISENFNAPFFKKNIALVWRSWHMTLYSWLRDYFFLPLFGYRSNRVKMEIGIVLTLVVSMLWHRFSASFLLLGLYHGLGLLAWSLFQEAKKTHPFLRRLVSSPRLDPVSIFATFSFFSFGMVLFQVNLDQLMVILRRVFDIRAG